MLSDAQITQIRERIHGEALGLDAQIATCQHSLHGTPIGCPHCARDSRQYALLAETVALVDQLRQQYDALLAEKASHRCSEHRGLCQRAQAAEDACARLRTALEEVRQYLAESPYATDSGDLLPKVEAALGRLVR